MYEDEGTRGGVGRAEAARCGNGGKVDYDTCHQCSQLFTRQYYVGLFWISTLRKGRMQ